MRVALKEVDRARVVLDVGEQGRAWKLFLLLPRMLLHRPPCGGLVPKSRLQERFSIFASGGWIQLLIDSQSCATQAATASRHRRRRDKGMILKQRQTAQLGELSAARHVLEGSLLAPWDSSNVGCASEP